MSEFWQAIATEYGESFGRTLTNDLVLPEFRNLTAKQAIAGGVDPRQVWLALCKETDVPPARWYGTAQQHPRN